MKLPNLPFKARVLDVSTMVNSSLKVGEYVTIKYITDLSAVLDREYLLYSPSEGSGEYGTLGLEYEWVPHLTLVKK